MTSLCEFQDLEASNKEPNCKDSEEV